MSQRKISFAAAVEAIAVELEDKCDSIDLARQLRIASHVMRQRQMSHLTGTITTLTAEALAKRSEVPEDAFDIVNVKKLLFRAALRTGVSPEHRPPAPCAD